MNYEKQANDFLKKANAQISIRRAWTQSSPTWIGGDENHGIKYNVEIIRGKKKFVFLFWDSLYNKENNKKPNEYDILACLTKYDPESLDDFCECYGYSKIDKETGLEDRNTIKIYNAVTKEYKSVVDLFGDLIDELQEIV